MADPLITIDWQTPLIGKFFDAPERKRRSDSDRAVEYLLPVISDLRSPVAEAFRFTAGSIERIHAGHGPQTSIVFVAPREGSGKSTVVANVALALAEGGRHLLAIDADAGGDLTALLLPDAAGADGFEQALSAGRALADCAMTSPWNRHVTVLAGGRPAPRRVSGLAYFMAVEKLLAESKSVFDIVLIDSPCLLSVADGPELVEAADVAVAVVRPRDLVRDHRAVVERLALVNTEFLGCVVEQASVRSDSRRPQRDDPAH